MDVSEDGTVTGSIDVAALDEVEPKTDEAQAALDALKARIASGQPVEAETESEVVAEEGSGDSEEYAEDGPQDDVEALRVEAEGLGVNVDGRWGAERLQQEIDAAKAGG